MTTLEQKKRSFLVGSWYAYEIEEMDNSIEFTPASIFKGLSILSEDYKVEKEILALEELICIILNLEELPSKASQKSKKKSSSKAKLKKLITYKFKLALCLDETLLFSNRQIPNVFKEIFADILHATSLNIKELSGSPPNELLMLHRQASQTFSDFIVLNENKALECIIENKEPEPYRNEVFLKIGSSDLPTPRIRKLSSTIRKMPFNTKEKDYRDIIMDTVKVEMQGQSLFHLYQSLAEENTISSVPEWLAACRNAGKTHRNVTYS